MTRTVSEIIARLLRSVMTPALLVGRSGSGGSARDNPRATEGFFAFSSSRMDFAGLWSHGSAKTGGVAGSHFPAGTESGRPAK